MTIRIVPYAAEHEEAVRAFNARLAAASIDKSLYSTRFPECHELKWLPKRDDCDLFQEQFVAIDDDSFVRGAYILKHQTFYIRGNLVRTADYRLPISEGIIDGRFTGVAVQEYMDAVRRQPCLFGLGGGGLHIPVNKFLMAAGFQAVNVPLYFRVVNSRRFFLNIRVLAKSKIRSTGLKILAYTGVGWLAVQAIQRLRQVHRLTAAVTFEPVDAFGDWADDIWRNSKDQYSLVAVRDRKILDVLYPRTNSRFIRIKVMRRSTPIGWAVLLNTQMSGHRQFGDMRVGSLVDCLSLPEDAPDIVACARKLLELSGVELIVSNQCSRAWCQALASCGFLEGPSNFPFLASPTLAAHLQPFEKLSAGFHLNRGDGDGPMRL